MAFPGDDDDTSAGRATQGGHRDELASGPARRSGNSFWWFAVALLVAVAIAVVAMTRTHRDAPAERNTVSISSDGGAAPPSGAAPGSTGAR